MVAKVIIMLCLGAGMVEGQAGYAVRYAPGRMARVAAVRGVPLQPCMVAWTHAQDPDIGETWLLIEGPAGRRRCLVVDLPQPRDRPGLLKRRVLVELDYRSARAVCGIRWQGRAVECPVRVRRLAES